MPRSRSRAQRQGGGKELADRSIGEMSSELINLHDVKSATRAIAAGRLRDRVAKSNERNYLIRINSESENWVAPSNDCHIFTFQLTKRLRCVYVISTRFRCTKNSCTSALDSRTFSCHTVRQFMLLARRSRVASWCSIGSSLVITARGIIRRGPDPPTDGFH